MIGRFLLALAALVGATAPAFAQSDEWHHAQSGIAIARQIGELRVGETRDLTNGAGMDVVVQLGSEREPATFYVYRSAYPNAALWFERTRLAMAETVQSGGERVEARPFTLGGGDAPNGLREEVALRSGGPFRSSAVALAQVGEWIVKLRITSSTMGAAEIRQRMDQLVAAIRLPDGDRIVHPLVVPLPCSDDMEANGSLVRRPEPIGVAAAAVTGMIAYGEARGRSGLAADPGSWCRMNSRIPVRYVTLYRHRTEDRWVALVADSGRAVAAHAVVSGSGAATFGSNPARTGVAALYTAMPQPDEAIMQALPVAVGQSEGLATVSVRQDRD